MSESLEETKGNHDGSADQSENVWDSDRNSPGDGTKLCLPGHSFRWGLLGFQGKRKFWLEAKLLTFWFTSIEDLF